MKNFKKLANNIETIAADIELRIVGHELHNAALFGLIPLPKKFEEWIEDRGLKAKLEKIVAGSAMGAAAIAFLQNVASSIGTWYVYFQSHNIEDFGMDVHLFSFIRPLLPLIVLAIAKVLHEGAGITPQAKEKLEKGKENAEKLKALLEKVPKIPTKGK